MTASHHVSMFADIRDNRPNAVEVQWTEFADYLEAASATPADPADKTETLCLSPARYRAGGKRGLADALSWDWAGVDLDDKTGGGWRFETAVDFLRELGLGAVVHTTSNSQPDAHRLRVLIPLARPVPAEEFRAFWYGLNALFGGVVDAQTKDISRLFVEPRLWTGADNRFARVAGVALCPDWLAAEFPAPPPPPEYHPVPPLDGVTLKAIDRAALTNIAVSPIVPKAALEKAIHAPEGGRMIAFLTSCAMSALGRGYAVDEADLMDLGQSLARMIGTPNRPDLRHDARSALRFARQRIASADAERIFTRQKALRGL